ncbi:MAG: methionine--tRNA ligase [Bacteroidales bacterium]|uniref:methionine--tRNA ligase n=1 Tax=Longimonas sp. TaxID=2039626 RepID=UPI003975598B
MKDFKRHLITSALPYANGPIHIGHLAGVYVPSDIYTRYLRLRGRDVIHICGSDEHGVPITIKARQEGVTPRQIVDRYHEMNKSSFEKFGISFDIYSRTSNAIHYETASEIFRTLYDKGEFIEKTTPQYYDEEAGVFLADRYIQGTCPHCDNENAFGDQCEKCGSSLNATDLINPRSTISGSKPVMKETKHWFLPLDKYEPFLKKWILEGKKHWKPNVYGQCKSWLDQGLQPRAVSRDLDWGVPVPLENAEGKVLYVWFDAPIGYISATRELTENWEKYWKDGETRMVHFIGKDNIVFHCIVFPSMLNAEGSYILPDNVPANEFLNLENDKISTSRNWAVWLHEYLEDFPGKQDVLRYVLCANAPETKDNDFTWKDFQARNNNELVAIYGNFINRAIVLTHKYFQGRVPGRGELSDLDREVLAAMPEIRKKLEESIEQFRFREALKEAMNMARLGNKYLADTEPWKIFKSEPERVKTIMNIALQISASLSLLTEPFLPFAAARLKKFLNISNILWDHATDKDIVAEGHMIGSGGLLFEKISDEETGRQVNKLLATREQNENKTLSPMMQAKDSINYDEFSLMDIRTGTIIEAEKVAKTKKLLKLTIDTGIDTRTVVSGIAEYFDPASLTGKQISVLVNLEAKKIRGIESRGMILMAEDPGGKLVFVSPTENIANGSVVK